jgi:hypothetical protein
METQFFLQRQVFFFFLDNIKFKDNRKKREKTIFFFQEITLKSFFYQQFKGPASGGSSPLVE